MNSHSPDDKKLAGPPLARLIQMLERTVTFAAAHELQSACGYTCADGVSTKTFLLKEYEKMLALARRLADPTQLSAEELVRMQANQDIAQFTFHLEVELNNCQQQPGAEERQRLAQSFAFLNRHISNLFAEFDQHHYRELPPEQNSLIRRLYQLTEAEYLNRFAALYASDDTRFFIDKFYRDYANTGIPHSLLTALQRIVREDNYELYIGILRGSIPYLLLLESLGLPRDKIKYLICGRTNGSHLSKVFRFEPVDFSMPDLTGRRILLVDNNIATGLTLGKALNELQTAGPESVSILADYILPNAYGRLDSSLEQTFGKRAKNIIIAQPLGKDSKRAVVPTRLLQEAEHALKCR